MIIVIATVSDNERIYVMDENKVIEETINFLEHGKYSERKQFIKDFRGDGVTMNGFTFKRTVDSVYVWKPTNISDSPEFKGEALLKIVPIITVKRGKVKNILKCQSWTYL